MFFCDIIWLSHHAGYVTPALGINMRATLEIMVKLTKDDS